MQILKQISNNNSRKIGKVVVLFVFVAFLSVLAEFLVAKFWFGEMKGNNSINTVKPSEISFAGFSEENGNLISYAKGDSLTIKNYGKYIGNLEIYFEKNGNYGVTIKFYDSENGQEIVRQNSSLKSMRKNKLDFLDFAVYKIKDNPQDITLVADGENVQIKEIRIDNGYYFNFYRFLFIFSVALLATFFSLFRKKIGERPETGFLAVALIVGTLMSFSHTKSYVSWDELIHFKNADDLTLKNFIRKDISDIYSRTNSVPFSYSTKQQEAIDDFFDSRYKKETTKIKSKKTKFSIIETYNRMAYVPSASVIFFGRTLHVPYHLIFILGRWINLLLYVFITYIAIRKLNSGKMLISVIALFPTAIFLASSYNYDSWINAFTFLGFAYLFSHLQKPKEKINKKDVFIMIGSFVLGLGPKAIYFLMMGLMLFVSKEKFESLKQYKRYILASVFSIIFVLGTFLLPFLVEGPGKGDHRGGKGVNSTQQVKFILSEPVEYSKILFNFVKNYVNPINFADLSVSFAYLGSIGGFFILMLTLLFVAITDRNEFDKNISSVKLKVAVIFIFLSTVILISTALYIAFTPVKSEIIKGVQPRYLIPLLFPFLYLIFNFGKIKNPFNKNIYNFVIFAIMAAVTMQGIWFKIIQFYY